MKNIIWITIALITLSTACAQQAIWGEEAIVSPEIQSDNKVTFRLMAPYADTVLVTGDFLPPEELHTPYGVFDVPGKAMLQKDNDGLWSYTSKTLTSDIYTYSFIIDGVTITDPNNVYNVRDVASVLNTFTISGEKADIYSVNNILHGSITHQWYNSPSLKANRRVCVYTPPGYENSSEQYPVLYLLHGAGGDEEAWIKSGRLPQILDNLIAQKKVRPMIVVMPNGNVTQVAAPGDGTRGYYKPQLMEPRAMNGEFESSFKDIINFTENNYRVIANKENRAIAGLSMGGFHAMHISRTYPNTFDYVGLFSTAMLIDNNKIPEYYTNTNETLKTQMQNGVKVYWISIGKRDFLYQRNKEFRAQLDELAFEYTYVESAGGHTWSNWRDYLTEFAPLLFEK